MLNTKGEDDEEAEWVRENAEQEGGVRRGGRGGGPDRDSRINTLMAVSQFLREIWTSNLACSAAAPAAPPPPPQIVTPPLLLASAAALVAHPLRESTGL